MTNLSSDIIELAVAALEKHAPTCKFNAGWCPLDEGVFAYRHGACHGGWQRNNPPVVATISNWWYYREPSYVESYSRNFKDLLPEEIGMRFYDWFVNRSWASDKLYAPSVEFAAKRGVIVNTKELPAPIALAIFTMNRNCGEQAHNVVRMYKFVDKLGISEDLAYIAAFGIKTSDYKGMIISGHNLVAPKDFTYLENWMAHRIVGQSSVNGMWGSVTDYSFIGLGKELKKKFPVDKKEEVVERVVVPNPFAPVVNASSPSLTEAELMEILPRVQEYFNKQEGEARVAA